MLLARRWRWIDKVSPMAVLYVIGLLVAGIVALFTTGIGKVVKVIKNIKLTQDKDMFNFTKKRQG